MIQWLTEKKNLILGRNGKQMVNGIDAERYHISLDSEGVCFNKKITTKTTTPLYEGNARLNKILHLAQNMYIGKTGEKIIDFDFYAYDNGGVLLEVQENYSMLIRLILTQIGRGRNGRISNGAGR